MKNDARNEYEFTLILDGLDDIDDEVIGRLLAAGCDDGLFGRSNGRMIATFSREADSFEDAVISAIRDITRADIGVTGFRLDSRDLVTQADIGRRIGKTKQAVSKYVNGKGRAKGFPAPAVASKDPLYQWADVADWLQRANLLAGDASRMAEKRRAVQVALEYAHEARREGATVRKVIDALPPVRSSRESKPFRRVVKSPLGAAAKRSAVGGIGKALPRDSKPKKR